jgi:hypothetical protein
MSEEIKSSLLLYADKFIALPPLPSLPSPVASHPDMLIFCYDKTIVTWKEYKALNPDIFTELASAGYEIITCDERAADKYPLDVPLNCPSIGNKIIANTKAVSNQIEKLADKKSLKILHTNQGYAKCSTCVVSDQAIITADTSIHALAENNGIASLLVSPNGVSLNGYDKGFIGGASGSDGTHVFFCGDLTSHPDGERISEFCEAHGKQALSLSDTPLYDYGTIFFLK